MEQKTGDGGQKSITESKHEVTCPLCRTTLIGEAIAAGKCQCCGHRFDPKEIISKAPGQA